MNDDLIMKINSVPYWLSSTDSKAYPSLAEDIKTDVVIVGGGMAGISCAYFLSKEGINPIIIEADNILSGTTAHTTAKITSQHDLIYNRIKNQMSLEYAKEYADANESAIKEIKNIVSELHIDCDLEEESAFIYTNKDEYIQKFRDEAETASNLGIESSVISEIPFNIPVKAALQFHNQAQFHPRKYLLALTDEITESGCTIYEQTRAVNIEEGDNYILTTEKGNKVTAKIVIIASHYPFYNKKGMYFSRLYADRSYVIAVKTKEKYPGGMYISAEDPGRSLRSAKTNNGELILVGGEHHKTGQGKDTIKHYSALADFAYNTFTMVDIPFRWSAQDCMTLDDIPYVGHFTADTPNLYIATGFGKWGMTNSTASAMIIKDLIVKSESPWQDVYNPSRKTIMASAKSFVTTNFNVAQNLIGGKTAELPKDINAEPGEGIIIDKDGERIGAFRDSNNALHLINTTCTHLGCELNFNSAEQTWDCPCHGSRFSIDGDIIEGPAVRPLEIHKDVNTVKKITSEDF